MAKFVLAGRADCPYYAKAEILAEYLQKNLPSFRVHKITQHPEDWEEWLQEICRKNGWNHHRSPIIWRELLDRGGKGLLLGGFNDFFEHAQEYYNITADMMSSLMKDIALENLETHIEIQKEQEEKKRLFNPLHVWITSATTPTCYNLIPLLASGEVFGMRKEIWLHLLETSHCNGSLSALVMEAEDLAFPLLRKVTVHKMADDTFLQADFVIVLDDAHVTNDQSPEKCIKQIAERCLQYGAFIDQNSNKGVKVVVAGSTYVNLKAQMILSNAPSINPHNVVALATQLEFEARAQIAKKLNINSAVVKDVILWGNISGTNFLDLQHAKIYQYDSAVWGPPGYWRPLKKMIFDGKWLKNEFLKEWRCRQQHRSGMSAAHSIAMVLSWWQQESNTGDIVSLGITSEGHFDLPEGIVYSMPVQFLNGDWQVYAKASVHDETKETLFQAAKELIKEKNIALGIQKELEIAEEGYKETTVIESTAALPTPLSSKNSLDNVETTQNNDDQTIIPTYPSREESVLSMEHVQEDCNQGEVATVPNIETALHNGDNVTNV
ncbi:putative malate dehydrogenase 1B [Xenopus laevis]|uniref:Putative malate dehydrogenase 1B n=2 Tax=Xenopus laevis TaxID=8355 RepID=A0A974C0D6_XENLA|nr:putative malate dehydrogenase 1B [Xenopus laevis]OCT63870.1 hypothetical protein XELAEV_18044965mg [Xenopus laevis]